MDTYLTWHRVAVVLSILSLLCITYATILINSFKTPQATADFLKNSNAYYYISEIIKANIRHRYPENLQYNIIRLSLADWLLNSVISADSVERLSLPLLQLRTRIAQLPMSFVEKNLVINTAQYTQAISQTLSSLGLPPALKDAANNLLSSVPPQIAIVDTQKNPNSVLVAITRTRIIFEHMQTLLQTAWAIFLLSLILLLISDIAFVKRLTGGLAWLFGICAAFLLVASFLFPPTATAIASNPDPVTGALKDSLWDSMLSYYLSLTQSVGVVYALLCVGFFALYRFFSFDRVQKWTNTHILHEQVPIKKPSHTKKR